MERSSDVLPKLIKAEVLRPASLFDEVIKPEDIGYTHSIFLQCFMPLRHNTANQRRWQATCGNASLVMRAGELINPSKPGKFKECVVPAGPKARLVAAYINDYAYRKRTREIDLGKSMRDFMEKSGIPIGGKNGKELQRELENFAATEIILGVWDPGVSAHQGSAKVAGQMSFWLEKTPDQMTFWQPSMVLSNDYYNSLMAGDHIAPIYWPGFVALQSNPRAMDILSFLTYRLRKPLARPVRINQSDLHAMFGQDVKRLDHFWPNFLKALKDAHKFYPTARVEPTKDGITLHSSPPLIPYRKIGRLPGA